MYLPTLDETEAVALTRLALSYSLGRSGISNHSRSYILKITQRKHREEVIAYQWEQLHNIIPRIKPYKWVKNYGAKVKDDAGSWMVRVCSKYLETAYNLLYGEGGFAVRSPVLELLGAEAIASLWCDRGEILANENRKGVLSRLHLVRHDREAARCIRDWLRTLTGAQGYIAYVSYSPNVPVLEFDRKSTVQLMESVRHTWYGKAASLERQFNVPQELREDIVQRLREQRTVVRHPQEKEDSPLQQESPASS